MTLDNLISKLQDVRAANGNVNIQLLELYGTKQRKGKKNSIFTNDIHLSYAEDEDEPIEQAPQSKSNPIGFC